AMSAKCQSNLRQVGISFVAYSGDNDDQFPPAYTPGRHTRPYATSWVKLLTVGDYFPKGIRPDGQADGRISKVAFCPVQRTSNWGTEWWNYNVSWELLGDAEPVTGGVPPLYVGQLSRSTSVLLVADVSQGNPGWACGFESPNWEWGGLMAPHNGRGNMLMADGHVESHRYHGSLGANGVAADVGGWDIKISTDTTDQDTALVWTRGQLGLIERQ
ncbi:MAG: hypothetical protein PF961_18210, partial [Planctomycetota bacterium]|nr:hypothetical protein [Planctomycetota bacterium]